MPQRNSRPGPHADLSISLDPDELDALTAANIRGLSRVWNIHQPDGKIIFRFDESGGASGSLGRYAGVLPLAGHPLLLRHRITSLNGNKEHSRVVGPAFVRFEVFRYHGRNVHAYITLHADGAHHLLFSARYGEVTKDGNVEFPPDKELEAKTVPSFLMDGFKAALEGARCDHCECASHFESVSPVKLPEGLLSTFHISAEPAPAAKKGK